MSVRFQAPDESGSENKKGLGHVDADDRKTSSRTKTGQVCSQGAGRLVALDAARGVAVIGMYLQHFASNERITAIVSGNTTLLFVLCGGISYSIMAQRMKSPQGDANAFRAKMLARALFVDVSGYLLILLNTSFGVILPAYAAMFVLALILVGRSNRVLATTTVALAFLAPPLMILGMSAFSGAFLLRDVAGGPMSALALAPAFVAGMAIGRLDLTKVRNAFLLAIGGLMMLIIGKTLGAYVLPGLSRSFESWLVSVQGTAAMPDLYAIWPLTPSSRCGTCYYGRLRIARRRSRR